MKFGVVTFGYDGFAHFAQRLNTEGFYDVNLGDNAQSIAIRQAYRRMGIAEDLIIDMNRDALPSYRGDPVILVMNGVFYENLFPLPEQIRPIFIGFNAEEHTIRRHAAIFRRYQPIGCRDEVTTRLMRDVGVEAYTSGCLTLTLDPRQMLPATPKMFIVHGNMAGKLPPGLLRHIPDYWLSNAELIYNRLPTTRFPFSLEQRIEAERYSRSLINRYSKEATIVVTPLHHVATPCMAMGIPVILCREHRDDRFSLLEKLTPIYLPGQFETINWNPAPVDISQIRTGLLNDLTARVVSTLRNFIETSQ